MHEEYKEMDQNFRKTARQHKHFVLNNLYATTAHGQIHHKINNYGRFTDAVHVKTELFLTISVKRFAPVYALILNSLFHVMRSGDGRLKRIVIGKNEVRRRRARLSDGSGEEQCRQWNG